MALPAAPSNKNEPHIAHSFALPVDACTCAMPLTDIVALMSEAAKREDKVKVFIGQERAKSALAFGLGMPAKGYNLYVMGEQATGQATLVQEYIAQQPSPSKPVMDWVYLHNIKDEKHPLALSLAPGESAILLRDMQNLIAQLLDTFPGAYDNPNYQRKKVALQKQHKSKYEGALAKVEALAEQANVALFEDEGTIAFLPIVDNQPIEEEAFATLDETTQAYFIEQIAKLEDELEEALLELPLWQRQLAKAQRELKQVTTEQNVSPLIQELLDKYAEQPALRQYIASLKSHIVDAMLWLDEVEEKEDKFDVTQAREYLESQYLPNIIVQQTDFSRAPVVYEANPTYQNLFGRIEYSTAQGSVLSDYRMISPGALHHANGGYLLLDADNMIEQPHVWESLKRALKQQQLRIDLPQQDAGMVNAVNLAPEPIALNVKIILLGSRELYYLLQEHDEAFTHLFRVLVDFEYDMPTSHHNLVDFVAQASAHAMRLGFTAITPETIRMLLRQSMRDAEHQDKISAQFADILEWMNEAAYYAAAEQPCTLSPHYLELAKQARRERTGRVAQTLLDDIKEGQILIQTHGCKTGTVNGLTVLDIGNSTFGTPAKITATVFAGASGVIDIEREVELGQSIHSKGVLLLTGYLGHKYAQHFPLTLSANIALEQSYGYIDGDSASLGELVALISALTNLPCLQSIAITGSINQYGEVQPVGGINEKIEGFFELCQFRGLDGTHGVIIPKANQVHLLLSDAVLAAIEQGLFCVYAVSTVDEALSILLQKEAGVQNSKGRYPKHTINYAALQQLYHIANIVNGSDE